MQSVLAFVFLLLCSCQDASKERSAVRSHKPVSADTLGDAKAQALSRELLAAFDRADEAAFASLVGARFVWIDGREVRERDDVLRGLRARRARNAPARTRAYGQEQTWASEGAAVFRGESVEHIPPEGARPTGTFAGWNTLVWARESANWKAVSWQWSRAGIAAAREEWNATYREGRAFNFEPSKFLTEMAKGRAPGRALDVGMGQGRNALYLAAQGWKVTGIDISDEGLRQATEAAAARKLSIEAIDADMNDWDYGVEQWDLVALIYAGGDAKLVNALRTSLKPGGIVVFEGFHRDAVPAIGTDPTQLATLFAEGFRILRNDVVEDVSDWGNQRGVPQKLVRFAAEKLPQR